MMSAAGCCLPLSLTPHYSPCFVSTGQSSFNFFEHDLTSHPPELGVNASYFVRKVRDVFATASAFPSMRTSAFPAAIRVSLLELIFVVPPPQSWFVRLRQLHYQRTSCAVAQFPLSSGMTHHPSPPDSFSPT